MEIIYGTIDIFINISVIEWSMETELFNR